MLGLSTAGRATTHGAYLRRVGVNCPQPVVVTILRWGLARTNGQNKDGAQRQLTHYSATAFMLWPVAPWADTDDPWLDGILAIGGMEERFDRRK